MIREKPKPCYRDRDNGVRFVKSQHRLDCADPECRGCTPCPETNHCTGRRNCSWHLPAGELTCGRCIGAVRTELRWIVALAALMPTQAMADGVASEAANLSGPAADPESWSWRKAAAKAGGSWHLSLVEDDDEHHPVRVLGAWERMIREDYGHDTDAPMLITTAADYLDRTLHRLANDETQDFQLLRAELRKCRQHLEAVLHNDEQRDRGAPCPTCTTEGHIVRLQRRYAHWCQETDCERFHFTDDGSDVWQCPRNGEHWWTMQGYADLLEDRRAPKIEAPTEESA